MMRPAKKVIAYVVNGGNLIFKSIHDCSEYFTELGHKLDPMTIWRKMEAGELWGYTERYIVNGRETVRRVELLFDELEEGTVAEAIEKRSIR